jgi:eukaryotic-like serine/threonine-protein kinase
MSAPDGGPVRIGNRYRIEESIGAGAMGAVWRAVDELLGRTVAVKELLAVMPGTSGSEIEESRQRILREGRIGARLQHANVISMFDVVIHDDSPWLVMEYLPSESLAVRLALHGPLQVAEVAEIGRQMADGLAAAHLAGVVHRDVKPGNVLISANGLVKLTDFGVSRAADEVQLTRTGQIAGTPAYLAPEVAQGREPTAASDVFALGATLYAAVEGTPPFGLDDNAYALLHKVATAEPEPPQQAGPLSGVLMRLLSVDPEDRPSAAQARDLLAAVAAGAVDSDADPVEVSPSADASRKPEVRRLPGVDGWYRGRRVAALLGLLLAVLVLGGGATIIALTTGAGSVAAAPHAGPSATAAPTPAAASPVAASPVAVSPVAVSPVAVSPVAVSPVAATPVASSPAASPPSPAPRSSPTPGPRPSPAPAPAPGPASGTDPVAFVQRYYALLPANTDAAFALLGPRARSQAGGATGFANFYARMQSVTLLDPRRIADGSVDATVRFVQKDGTTSNEPYRFVITKDGSGKMMMESFMRM